MLLAYQSLGVVYGDVCISPLYVYSSMVQDKMLMDLDGEIVFGTFSLIFWTLTLIPLFKYVGILLSADDNGEGIILMLIFILDDAPPWHLFLYNIENGSYHVYSLII